MALRRLLCVLSVVSCVWFTSCSSTPPICRPENARSAGVASAMRGEEYSEAPGAVCEDENKAIFKNNFMAGYREGKQKLCDPANAENTGKSVAQSGKASDFSDAQYRICENPGAAKFAYNKGYQKGAEEFCSESKSQAAGDARGSAGQPSDFSDATYSICPKGRMSKLHAAYDRGHKAGLDKFCTPGDADAKGFQDGGAGAGKEDIQARYQLCSNAKRTAIVKAYDQGYDRGMQSYCQPANIDKEAVAQAQNAVTPTLPAKYGQCFNRFPELTAHYNTTFNDERKRVIAARCTYQAGVATGQSDANASNNKNTGMPNFCDTSLFNVYLTGYLEGWKQTKDRMCDVTAAYGEGVKRGQGGASLQYSPPGNCPPEYDSLLRQKFNEGYQLGMSQRPQAVVVPGGVGQVACRSSLDCPSGSFCRDRGDGARFCMGKGKHGDFCQSSLDCMAGLFCRDQANVKICR